MLNITYYTPIRRKLAHNIDKFKNKQNITS